MLALGLGQTDSGELPSLCSIDPSPGCLPDTWSTQPTSMPTSPPPPMPPSDYGTSYPPPPYQYAGDMPAYYNQQPSAQPAPTKPAMVATRPWYTSPLLLGAAGLAVIALLLLKRPKTREAPP